MRGESFAVRALVNGTNANGTMVVASLPNGSRCVGGNKYRLVAKMLYKGGIVLIRHVLTTSILGIERCSSLFYNDVELPGTILDTSTSEYSMTTTISVRRARKVPRPIDKPIRNRRAYDEAQAELDAIVDDNPAEGTHAHDRMELLAILIQAYEAETLPPFEPPTPQQMVQHMAEQKGISSGQLAEVMGGRSRLSDLYHSRRPLSTGQIVKLRELLGIPADYLISRPHRAKALSRTTR
jgi:HTH-type transcriptional regulator/antitoxin HigA